jgi:hypothetical protein
MGPSCLNIKSKAMQCSLYDEHIKGTNEPLCDNKYLLFKFSVMSEVCYGLGIMKIKFLNCKRRSFR